MDHTGPGRADRRGPRPLILLAIDTSTPRAALALDLGPDGGPPRLAPIDADPGRRHGRGLIPAIKALLESAGITARDLGALAVGLGPGSYTGLRIGLTAAKTIAYAAGVPLYPLDSLEAIARSAPLDAAHLAVVVDAQRGDGYVAEFARDRPGDAPRRLTPTRVEPLVPWALAHPPRAPRPGPPPHTPPPRPRPPPPALAPRPPPRDPRPGPPRPPRPARPRERGRRRRPDRRALRPRTDLSAKERRGRPVGVEDPAGLSPFAPPSPSRYDRAMPPTTTPDQARTQSAYALQWNTFRIVRPEEDRATFRNRTGLSPEDLAGSLVLDAGCGMGRYLRVAAEGGARAVGIDLSRAVEAARDLTAEYPSVSVVQGDLLRTPFAPGTFDHIYSLGVLDHTPDAQRAFLGLAQLLKPGGRIAIWVYPRERPTLERIMDAHRAISTRLPLPALVAFSRLMAPVGALKRRLMASPRRPIERLGVALNLLTIGVSMHPDPEVRVCDTLDWYAPRYLTRHTLEEVAAWFAEAGLVDVVDLSKEQNFFHAGQGNGINLAGRRPRGDQ